MHVGYNRFPSGTVVRWSVSQAKSTVSSGQFTALGGGKTYHFLMLALGVTLQNTSKGTTHFHWSTNGTPFTYTAGREPGC